MQNIIFTLTIALALTICRGFVIKQSRMSMLRSRSLEMRSISKNVCETLVTIGLLFGPLSCLAADQQQFRLPPIDRKDANRCTLVSSAMGQANAGRDKLLDLRECDIKGQSAAGKDLSGLIGSNADFSGVNFKETQISKAYARASKFVGCDFTNGIIDRASFDGSDMKKAIFVNAVLSGTTFTDSDLQDTDFTDAYLGPFDLKNLCLNPTLSGTNPVTGKDTRESAGCAD